MADAGIPRDVLDIAAGPWATVAPVVNTICIFNNDRQSRDLALLSRKSGRLESIHGNHRATTFLAEHVPPSVFPTHLDLV